MLELLGLICTIPTAYLAFKERAVTNFIDQCKDLLSKEGSNYRQDIRWDYKLIAKYWLGIKGDLDWLQVFGSSTSEIRKKIDYDKSDAIRGFVWFVFSFFFFSLALILRH